MSVYNLTEYIDNYSKTSGSLWQYYRDEPALTNAGAIIFMLLITVLCLNLSKKITGKTADGGTKDVEIMVPLKYLSNF